MRWERMHINEMWEIYQIISDKKEEKKVSKNI